RVRATIPYRIFATQIKQWVAGLNLTGPLTPQIEVRMRSVVCAELTALARAKSNGFGDVTVRIDVVWIPLTFCIVPAARFSVFAIEHRQIDGHPVNRQ